MKSTRQYSVFYNLFLAIFLLSISVIAQEWQLVWSDELITPACLMHPNGDMMLAGMVGAIMNFSIINLMTRITPVWKTAG